MLHYSVQRLHAYVSAVHVQSGFFPSVVLAAFVFVNILEYGSKHQSNKQIKNEYSKGFVGWDTLIA